MHEAASLSPREFEVATAYAAGATYRTIAKKLGLAPTTIRSHVTAIYRKLEVTSKLGLKIRLEERALDANLHRDHLAVMSELALGLEEAISREKALSVVLQIISQSDGAIDAVVQSIMEHALELCDAECGVLFEYCQEGRFRSNFTVGIAPLFESWLEEQDEFLAGPMTGLGRMNTQKKAVNIADAKSEKIYPTDDPLRLATTVLGQARSLVAIPMLVGDKLDSAFIIFRKQVRPFTESTTRLISFFSNHGVIAINNAKLVSALRM